MLVGCDRGAHTAPAQRHPVGEPAQPNVAAVTSRTPSVELEGWVGLALVAAGRSRIGTRLNGAAPVHAERTELELVSPHMVDPENLRVRA